MKLIPLNWIGCRTTALMLLVYFSSCFLYAQGNLPRTQAVPQRNCQDLYEAGITTSGLYTIAPSGENFTVYCDMSLRGGGWTVIQRRVNDDVSFDRNWNEYRNGFGDLTANFWLGLQKIRNITNAGSTVFELYIGMESFHPTDTFRFSLYNSFSIDSVAANYTLHIGTLDPESDAGDSLFYHNGRQFSTPDRDNDSSLGTHCAELFRAGWWFHSCHDSLLNGHWYADGLMPDPNFPDGIIWETWVGDRESLKSTVMAVRPV